MVTMSPMQRAGPGRYRNNNLQLHDMLML